jgi:hypothetical protein
MEHEDIPAAHRRSAKLAFPNSIYASCAIRSPGHPISKKLTDIHKKQGELIGGYVNWRTDQKGNLAY